MSDAKDSARETQVRLRITIESALHNLHGFSDDLISAQIVMLMNAAGYITTAEADLRVADMRERAALICDDMLHPEYQSTCRVCRNVQSIRALPLTEEGGTDE